MKIYPFCIHTMLYVFAFIQFQNDIHFQTIATFLVWVESSFVPTLWFPTEERGFFVLMRIYGRYWIRLHEQLYEQANRIIEGTEPLMFHTVNAKC